MHAEQRLHAPVPVAQVQGLRSHVGRRIAHLVRVEVQRPDVVVHDVRLGLVRRVHDQGVPAEEEHRVACAALGEAPSNAEPCRRSAAAGMVAEAQAHAGTAAGVNAACRPTARSQACHRVITAGRLDALQPPC